MLVEDFGTPVGGGVQNGDTSQGLRLPYVLSHTLIAPGNGLLRVSVVGNCIGHGHMAVDVNGVRYEVEVGDGVGGLTRTFPVALGDSLEVRAIVSDFDEETTLELQDGSFAVLFEPS